MATTIEEGLTTFILADPAVTALIGNRFGPWSGQLDYQPFVTYELVGEDNLYSLSGSTDEPTARFVISCWGVTQTQARQIAYTLKNSRGGGTGARLKELGAKGHTENLGGVTATASIIENQADAEVPPIDFSDNMQACVKFDLSIAYLEL